MKIEILLEFLNDKLPAWVTDDYEFLNELGDFIKYEGIVYTTRDFRERTERLRIYWEFACFIDLLPEEWEEYYEDGDVSP
jgi:hypothetical protein